MNTWGHSIIRSQILFVNHLLWGLVKNGDKTTEQKSETKESEKIEVVEGYEMEEEKQESVQELKKTNISQHFLYEFNNFTSGSISTKYQHSVMPKIPILTELVWIYFTNKEIQ